MSYPQSLIVKTQRFRTSHNSVQALQRLAGYKHVTPLGVVNTPRGK